MRPFMMLLCLVPIAAGEGNFDGSDIGALRGVTLDLVSLITRQDCGGYLLP